MVASEKKEFRPFSNGTEYMIWDDENCSRCVKAFRPKEGMWPSEKTLKQYVSIGKYCKLQYDLDMATITGTIPMATAQQIGLHEQGYGLKSQCMFFSDNEDDGFKYPKRPRPDNTPDNQLVMPFYNEELESHFGERVVEKIEKLVAV
jgi:hypothetical protein